jgi:calcium-dependent protein kinase
MDLKPENIMFDSEGANGVLKVVDLGAAEFVGAQGHVQHAFGTVRYSSPEMAREGAGQKSDVWSAGVVVYQILSGKVPFLKRNDVGTLEYIMKGPQVRLGGRGLALEKI